MVRAEKSYRHTYQRRNAPNVEQKCAMRKQVEIKKCVKTNKFPTISIQGPNKVDSTTTIIMKNK